MSSGTGGVSRKLSEFGSYTSQKISGAKSTIANWFRQISISIQHSSNPTIEKTAFLTAEKFKPQLRPRLSRPLPQTPTDRIEQEVRTRNTLMKFENIVSTIISLEREERPKLSPEEAKFLIADFELAFANFSSLSPENRVELCKKYRAFLQRPEIAKLLKKDSQLIGFTREIQGLIQANPRAQAVMQEVSKPPQPRDRFALEVRDAAHLIEKYPELKGHDFVSVEGRRIFKHWAKANMTEADVRALGAEPMRDSARRVIPELDSACKEVFLEEELIRKGCTQASVTIVKGIVTMEIIPTDRFITEWPKGSIREGCTTDVGNGCSITARGGHQIFTLTYSPATWQTNSAADTEDLEPVRSNLRPFLEKLGIKAELGPLLDEMTLEVKKKSVNQAAVQFIEAWKTALEEVQHGADSTSLELLLSHAKIISQGGLFYAGFYPLLNPEIKAEFDQIVQAADRPLVDLVQNEQQAKIQAAQLVPIAASSDTMRVAHDIFVAYPVLRSVAASNENGTLKDPEGFRAELQKMHPQDLETIGQAVVVGEEWSTDMARICKEVYLESCLKAKGYTGGRVHIEAGKITVTFSPPLQRKDALKFKQGWERSKARWLDNARKYGRIAATASLGTMTYLYNDEQLRESDDQIDFDLHFDRGDYFSMTYRQYSPNASDIFIAFMDTIGGSEADVGSFILTLQAQKAAESLPQIKQEFLAFEKMVLKQPPEPGFGLKAVELLDQITRLGKTIQASQLKTTIEGMLLGASVQSQLTALIDSLEHSAKPPKKKELQGQVDQLEHSMSGLSINSVQYKTLMAQLTCLKNFLQNYEQPWTVDSWDTQLGNALGHVGETQQKVAQAIRAQQQTEVAKQEQVARIRVEQQEKEQRWITLQSEIAQFRPQTPEVLAIYSQYMEAWGKEGYINERSITNALVALSSTSSSPEAQIALDLCEKYVALHGYTETLEGLINEARAQLGIEPLPKPPRPTYAQLITSTMDKLQTSQTREEKNKLLFLMVTLFFNVDKNAEPSVAEIEIMEKALLRCCDIAVQIGTYKEYMNDFSEMRTKVSSFHFQQ